MATLVVEPKLEMREGEPVVGYSAVVIPKVQPVGGFEATTQRSRTPDRFEFQVGPGDYDVAYFAWGKDEQVLARVDESVTIPEPVDEPPPLPPLTTHAVIDLVLPPNGIGRVSRRVTDRGTIRTVTCNKGDVVRINGVVVST